jgi:hypothetical protein
VAKRLLLAFFVSGAAAGVLSFLTLAGSIGAGAAASAATLAGPCGLGAVIDALATSAAACVSEAGGAAFAAVACGCASVCVGVAALTGAGVDPCTCDEGAFVDATGGVDGASTSALVTRAWAATEVCAASTSERSSNDKTTAAPAVAPTAVATMTVRAVRRKLGAGAR